LAGKAAQMGFEGCKRADAAGKFDIDAPYHGRQVQHGQPPPVQNEKTTGDDKDDKQQVQKHDQIGEDSIEHRCQWKFEIDTTPRGTMQGTSVFRLIIFPETPPNVLKIGGFSTRVLRWGPRCGMTRKKKGIIAAESATIIPSLC
jgi:hypothetical protein